MTPREARISVDVLNLPCVRVLVEALELIAELPGDSHYGAEQEIATDALETCREMAADA